MSLIQGGVEKRMTVSSGMNMAGESLLEALHSSEVTPSAPEKPLPLSHRTTRRYMSHATSAGLSTIFCRATALQSLKQ